MREVEAPLVRYKSEQHLLPSVDRVSRQGGAVQYIISRADRPKLVYVGETRRAT